MASEQTGQVLITASSASEDAQESDAIQGSFFTHFLTSGLRGAADRDNDGKVTLGEAYEFAYAHTVSNTVGTHAPSNQKVIRPIAKNTGLEAASLEEASTWDSNHFLIHPNQ